MARIRAPELVGSGGWINTREPLSLTNLVGKVVVVDFWNSCCVNCQRVFDELRPIEGRFADEVVVIGVHSPKFPREHDHPAVVRAVERLRITHPVLDDPELATWQQYGVRGWPTVVVIDPEGYIVGGISGEGSGPVVTQTVEALVTSHAAKGTLARGRIMAITPPADAGSLRVLSYPGKVAADPAGQRLAVADTGHDRVLVCDWQGRVEREIPLLSRPQGVRFDGSRLIVCDTGADRVVSVDLSTAAQTVLASGLASPWDVAVIGDGSYLVAEAGRHRLWSIRRGADAERGGGAAGGDGAADGAGGGDAAGAGGDDAAAAGGGGAPEAGGGTEVVAGTGEENLVDGPGLRALLAQPSGVCPLPSGAAFVDAESSALRVLNADGNVVTLVGQGLFDWGASDGGPDSSALQHPLGVAASDGVIYVADTFNSLLRAWSGTDLSAGAGSLRTLPVEGLEEPGGLDVLADGRLVVADTNHHRVVLVDPQTGLVQPVIIDESWAGTIAGDRLSVQQGEVVAVPYDLDPGGFRLDPTAGPPVHIQVSAVPATLLAAGPRMWELDEGHGVLQLPAGQPGSGTLAIEVVISVCDDLQCTTLQARTRHDLTVQGRDPAPAEASASVADTDAAPTTEVPPTSG